MRRILFATVMAVMVVGCTEINLPTGPGGITVIQQVDSANNGAVPGQPTPAATGSIYKVKVGFFGGSCPDGPLQPGQTELKNGCVGTMTATPKIMNPDGRTDRDATEAEHGPDDEVRWIVKAGPSVLVCTTSPGNGFNRDCTAKAIGAWEQCAVVKGVEGCAKGNVS